MASKEQGSNLKELVDLFNSGAIDKEEFEILKKALPNPSENASKENITTEDSLPIVEKNKSQLMNEENKEKATKKQKKSSIYLIYTLFTIALIALIISLVSFFNVSNERDNLLKENLTNQTKIEQLTKHLQTKSDSVNELNKKLLLSAKTVEKSVQIPVPNYVKRKISVLKRNRSNWFTDEIEFYKIGSGSKYELRAIEGWHYSTFVLDDLYSDKWTFNIPGQGSGGGNIDGIILFTAKGVIISQKRPSCAGANNCYEYTTVTYNNSTVHQLKTAL